VCQRLKKLDGLLYGSVFLLVLTVPLV
jgi:hypothetical protein